MTDPTLDEADPAAVLAAYLRVHAQGAPSPAALFAKGEAVYERLRRQPPATGDWGRFLVAQGELAAEHLGDAGLASRYFRAALESVAAHGDNDVAVTAGFNQGVIHERRGNRALAVAAYAAAAGEGFRLCVASPSTLRAALAAIRLAWDETETLHDQQRAMLKQTWLLWLWLRSRNEAMPADLTSELGRMLAAFLLPEDDPAALAARWRAWSPHRLDPGPEAWTDSDPACLKELYRAAIAAAEEHLRDEQPDPAEAYRKLLESLR